MSPARPLLSTAVLLVAFLLSMTPHYCVGNEPGDTSAYIAWWTKYSSEEALRDALRKVPEVDLGIEAGESGTESGKLLQKYVAEINQKNRTTDGFVHELAKRADLSGLPFRFGHDALLNPRTVIKVGQHSRAVRLALDAPPDGSNRLALFWSKLPVIGNNWDPPIGDRALVQVLSAETQPFRRSLVDYLSRNIDRAATKHLARLAVFDLDARVRNDALEALRDRPHADFKAALLEGFRYPWAPVAHNAGRAAVILRVKEIVPDLVEVLAEPDPERPFETDVGGHKTWMVRELVAINHHKNCLLCHAPALTGKEAVRAPVPVLGSRFPVLYYDEDVRSGVQVQADVTYLRQDFSTLQEVADAE